MAARSRALVVDIDRRKRKRGGVFCAIVAIGPRRLDPSSDRRRDSVWMLHRLAAAGIEGEDS